MGREKLFQEWGQESDPVQILRTPAFHILVCGLMLGEQHKQQAFVPRTNLLFVWQGLGCMMSQGVEAVRVLCVEQKTSDQPKGELSTLPGLQEPSLNSSLLLLGVLPSSVLVGLKYLLALYAGVGGWASALGW